MRGFVSSVVNLVSKKLGKGPVLQSVESLFRREEISSSVNKRYFLGEGRNCSGVVNERDTCKLVDKPRITNRVQKSWATSIIKGDTTTESQTQTTVTVNQHSQLPQRLLTRAGSILNKKLENSDEEANNKQVMVTSSRNKKPVKLYRRRMSDSTWTTAPMDDKLIWVDCEMTGLDIDSEMIMEIGCIITGPNLEEIAMQPSVIIHVPEEKLEQMSAWCLKHHGDSGLTDACRKSTVTSEEVDELLLKFVQKYTTQGECPMAGNSIFMDRLFVSKQFPKFNSHFHYRNVDVSTIKELVRRWYPDEFLKAPKKKFSHRVIDDIQDSIAELKYYRTAIFRDSVEPTERKISMNTIKRNGTNSGSDSAINFLLCRDVVQLRMPAQSHRE